MIQNIADFFLTIYRVSFKPQEVYRELDTVPGRRRQGWILAVAVAAVGLAPLVLVAAGLALDSTDIDIPSIFDYIDIYNREVFPDTEARFGDYAFLFFSLA